MTAKRKRVVILGGGFAGVFTAKRLIACGRRDVEVHLVNRENYLVFQPMLPQVISGSVGIADTISPIRRLVPGVQLHVRDVESVDLGTRTVTCSPGFRPRPLVLPFDHLVVAVGNVTDFRGLTGLPEHALPFKTLGDALALRNHTIGALEEAASERDPELRRMLLTFVVAGGGFSGVEVCAELHDFVRRALATYPSIAFAECRFVLLHSRDRILPEMDDDLARYAQSLLIARGVEVRLNSRLTAATGEHAILGDGTRIPTATLVATVPSHPNPVVEALALPKDKGGRLLVDGTMRVPGTDNVWALGDCALVPLPQRGGEVRVAPPTAQHAIREAALLADNILATARGIAPRPFTFEGLGAFAALGHRKGIARVLNVKLSGFPGWLAWRAVYLMKLPGLDRKIKVGLSWLLDLFFPPDLVQLPDGRSSGVSHEHFEPGQVIFHQGDLGDRMYVIVKGTAEVVHFTPDGREIRLALLDQGHFFGEMALMHRAPRNATVRCLEPMDVVSVQKRDFTELVTHLADLRAMIEQTMGDRLRERQRRESVSAE
jgi:NADH:ubiquinone reductase (H+-translocating)